MSSRQELNKLEREIYEHRNNPGMDSMVEYLNGSLEDVKDLLTGCAPQDMGDLQGQARVLKSLIRVLTEAPFDISGEE